jgi:VWFA-related protein
MNNSRHACLVLFLCLPAFSAAQSTVPTAPQGPALAQRPAPGAAEGRMKLDVLVTDKSGKPVSGLELKDFTLLDNDQSGKIVSFHAYGTNSPEPGPPVLVILTIDLVNVGIEWVKLEFEQTDKFLRQNGGHLALPVAVFKFTDKGMEVVAQPSTDGNAIADQLQKSGYGVRAIPKTTGEWGYIENFEYSIPVTIALAKSEETKPGRKLVVWYGPGWPLLDNARVQSFPKGDQQMFKWIVDLSTSLQQGRITLYNVMLGTGFGRQLLLYEGHLKGVRTPQQANPPNMGLEVFGDHTGGRMLGHSNDMVSQLNNCVQDASAYYTLSFDPPAAKVPNEYHDLKLTIDQPGLTAHTTTGYYNQP